MDDKIHTLPLQKQSLDLKLQIPSSKSQINSNLQYQITKTFCLRIEILVIGICLLFGAWGLVLYLTPLPFCL
jgi:uncharacterized membrane protein